MSARQIDTFIYLFIATVLSAFLCFFFLPAPPLLFGAALAYSNKKYLKFDAGYIFIIGPFFGWFFFTSSVLSSEMTAINRIIICYLTFIMVFAIAKLNLKKVRVGITQIVLLVLLPIASLFLTNQINIWNIGQLQYPELGLMVLVYQSGMTLMLTSMVKDVTNEDDQEMLYNDI